jgi:hypothetical protein
VSVVQPNSHVTVEYVLKDDEGEILDASNAEDGEPIEYVHGYGMLVPGLEAALVGSEAPGDKKKITVSADEGYGERDESSCSRSTAASSRGRRRAGDEFVAESPDGDEVASRGRGQRGRRPRRREPPPRRDDAPLRGQGEVGPRGHGRRDRGGRKAIWTTRTSTSTAPTAITITSPPGTAVWSLGRKLNCRLRAYAREAKANRIMSNKTINAWDWDIRVRERNAQGHLDDKDIEKHIAQLPDVARAGRARRASPQPAIGGRED